MCGSGAEIAGAGVCGADASGVVVVGDVVAGIVATGGEAGATFPDVPQPQSTSIRLTVSVRRMPDGFEPRMAVILPLVAMRRQSPPGRTGRREPRPKPVV
jgi:hypothetical protein